MTDVVLITIPTLVDAIVARLKAKITGFTIEPTPDKPDNYKLNSQKGAFLVQYRGADYDETEDTDAIVQVRRQQIDVVIISRALNGAGASYAMLEAARTALVGYKQPGFTKITAVRERFIGRDENVWTYQLTISTTTLAVELEDEAVDVLLAHLTFAGPSTLEIPNA